jgi:hypothetical protein
MERKRVYITVKTYPTLSEKYDELVCTAGICEDGSWIRLYPLPFRKLEKDQKYKKYQWVEVEVERNTSDFRTESYKVSNRDTIQVSQPKNIKSVNWDERKRVIFKSEKAYTNLSEIIGLAKKKPLYKSLAIFKPTKLLDFYSEPTDRDWSKDKIECIQSKAKQLSLFQTLDEVVKEFSVVQKLPYVFKYKFEDDNGKESNFMIEDWEIGTLYFNCLRNSNGDESRALEKVREKYWNDFIKKDLYFFLGTRKSDHHIALNPFSIVGVFYPPIDRQKELF